MCGIIGYFGKEEEVLDTLIAGLKKLEYRGYDSAGVAIQIKNNIYLKKAEGKVKNLEEKILKHPLKNSKSIGIAHTRWATHGVPSVNNAHPQFGQNKNIFLVHNGIIENYKDIKSFLIKKGVKFNSETDTEVIAQLIEYNYRGDLKKAVLKSLKSIKGAFAVAVFSKDENRLIGFKKGSPLVLGIVNGDEPEFILSSDISAFVSKTKKVIYLQDGEMVDIFDGKFKFFDFCNEIKKEKIQTINWDVGSISKNGYKHFLIKEIMEQPETIKDSIRGRLIYETGDIKFGGLEEIQNRLKKINRVVIVGIGTSAYSAMLGEIYFEEISRMPTKVELSPEFRYKDIVLDKNTWVIAMSQSGETADTIAAIKEAKRKGALVTGIVNSVGSTISRITDAGVYNHIGPEISVASTKAFTSQSVLLLMHALMLGRLQGKISLQKAQKIISEINKLPALIEKTLKEKDKIKKIAKKYIKHKNLFYIGRKYNYPTALEGALKIKELAYIHAEGMAGGELKHGFIALVDKNMPTVAIATKDSIYEKQISNIEEVRARGGKVFSIATKGDKKIKEISDDVIYIPKVSEELSPILNTAVLQLLAYYTSDLKGLDVDQPRNLAKSVTVE